MATKKNTQAEAVNEVTENENVDTEVQGETGQTDGQDVGQGETEQGETEQEQGGDTGSGGENNLPVTELHVSPASIYCKVGETKTIDIRTNALDFNYTIKNEAVISFDKVKKAIKGIGKGDAQLIITAQVENGLMETKTITCHIAQNIDLDFGTEEEILENTYHYDQTLPLSVNGTIAYKKGDNDSDPLIKLVFDGKLQRWQVIGIKIVKWNEENEPYSLYFMASEGAVGNALSNMNLQKVIIDLIDALFVSETDNMTFTIRKIFKETIDPLVQAEMAKIPQLVQNEITNEVTRIIQEQIKLELNKQFDVIIEENVDKKIGEYVFSDITPYNKEKQTPKWVGLLITKFERESITGRNNEDQIFTRRLNTNGIEERFMNVNEMRINDLTNDDALTKMFDSIEPYKSMERMEIMCKDLGNIAGDSIYGKEMFQRLMSQSKDKNDIFWNGDFTTRVKTEIFNRESMWFVPLKKCHYIDVEFSLNGDTKNRYILKAVGEFEFEVNLAEIFPNATSISLHYFHASKTGFEEFYVNGMTIRSNVHPAFLNYYDQSLNIMDTPVELDYVYYGAFWDSLVPMSNDLKGVATNTQCLMPRPFGSADVLRDVRQSIEQNVKYWLGQNPKIGVNLRNTPHTYIHLYYLLETIESGGFAYGFGTKQVYKQNWKFIQGQSFTQHAFKTGVTFTDGSRSRGAWNGYTYCSNYRGIEAEGYWYNKIEGCYNYKPTGVSKLYLEVPHTSRYKPSFAVAEIEKGIHWIDTGHSMQAVTSNENIGHTMANSLSANENIGNFVQTNMIYNKYNNSDNREFMYIAKRSNTNLTSSVVARWRHGTVWDSAARGCI